MMGGVSPETCWASYKYEIKFWYTVASCWIFFVNCIMIHCGILLDFLCELYYDTLWHLVGFSLWIVLWYTMASCWIFFVNCIMIHCGILLDFLCELYYDTLWHLVGFSLWIVLWYTDPRTWSTGLVKIMLTLMDYFSPADGRTPWL